MKILVFAGAGTSVELGVPGMVGLGEEFLAHARSWNTEPDLVETLLGESFDVEELIDALDKVCTARAPLKSIGGADIELDRADSVRAEVEWFVQHAAERIAAREARLMWGPVLRTVSNVETTLITTNYDRAIELAAHQEAVELDDGFADFGHGELAEWVGFREPKRPRLVKLHGSTDWYAREGSGAPVKLRHPMPLFGRAALRLSSGSQLGSALVLPSREKLLTHSPYPRLSQTFLNAADTCDVAVVVGSSLRDPHIRDAAVDIASRAQLFIVDPFDPGVAIENATTIKQYASHFLVSTLPMALRSDSPDEVLTRAAATGRESKSILSPLAKCLDADSSVERRCESLEFLDRLAIALDPPTLHGLLDDPALDVARYALGIIAHSVDAGDLLERAAASEHAQHGLFAEDLEMLRDLLSDAAS